MRIVETIERDCCARNDLKNYKGQMTPDVTTLRPLFCMHCGQIWVREMEMSPAGSMETVLKQYTLGGNSGVDIV